MLVRWEAEWWPLGAVDAGQVGGQPRWDTSGIDQAKIDLWCPLWPIHTDRQAVGRKHKFVGGEYMQTFDAVYNKTYWKDHNVDNSFLNLKMSDQVNMVKKVGVTKVLWEISYICKLWCCLSAWKLIENEYINCQAF